MIIAAYDPCKQSAQCDMKTYVPHLQRLKSSQGTDKSVNTIFWDDLPDFISEAEKKHYQVILGMDANRNLDNHRSDVYKTIQNMISLPYMNIIAMILPPTHIEMTPNALILYVHLHRYINRSKIISCFPMTRLYHQTIKQCCWILPKWLYNIQSLICFNHSLDCFPHIIKIIPTYI